VLLYIKVIAPPVNEGGRVSEGARVSKQAETVDCHGEGFGEELRRAIGQFVRFVRADVGAPPSARIETLALLGRRGTMNTASLAKLRNVKHQTMRLIVSHLESSGLIVGMIDPKDRRSRAFCLTAAGKGVLDHDRQMRASSIDKLLYASISGEERVLLSRAITILDRISSATGG
jgi:DNA-binding MarR family transcriptional regulator